MTELIALQPKAPWVVEEGQIQGHEDEWKNANVKNQPYLSYRGTNIAGTPAPPPQRQQMAGVPAGIVQAAADAQQDMMATTGIRFDSTMNERMIDESGKAIRELRRSGDLGAFHYVDNLARALRRCGEILVEAIPFVYDEPRVATILREDDKEEQIRIDPFLARGSMEERRPDGKMRKMFNPTFGKYGVTVTIGPSYATKRIEASENMMAFMKALPQTAALVADLFAAEQDWPGAEKIAARLAKTVPPQLMQPDMKDVPPQIAALLQGLESNVKQLQQQLMLAQKELQDKSADRQVDVLGIQKDFEAKVLKLVTDFETKMAAVQEKATANANTHLVAQMKEIGGIVQNIEKTLDRSGGDGGPGGDGGGAKPANDQAGDGMPPPEALAFLRPGRHTVFANGQKWTAGENGKPQRLV
jgi:Skp family chaperone for outer membrane proteins